MDVQTLTVPTGHVDLQTLTVHRGGQLFRLTVQEADLLRYLARAESTVTRAELLVEVWGYSPQVRSRAVDATVSRLRTKLENDPSEPQCLLSVRGRGYRLRIVTPLPRTELLGRESERLALRTAAETGLVLLVGRGGAGKSSLAQDYADQYGATFVDLSGAVDVAGAHSAIAHALGVNVSRDKASKTLERLVTALEFAGRPLVLDNLEQLPEAFASSVATLAEAGVPVVLTSRTVMDDTWSRLHVGPLPPDAAREVLLRSARRRSPRWTGDTEALDRLATLLDRLPLGLELVGSQLPLSSPDQLVERFSELLQTRNGPEGRHASLADSLRWSWSLLDPVVQRRVMDWAVIRGRLELELLESMHPGASLQTLDQLTRAGWIDTGPSGPRLWEAARAFCLAALEASGNEPAATDAHARWLFAQLPEAPDALAGAERTALHDRLHQLRPEIDGASKRLLQRDPETATRLLLGLLEIEHQLVADDAAAQSSRALTAADASGVDELAARARLAQLRVFRRSRDPERDQQLLMDCERALDPVDSDALWARYYTLLGHHRRGVGELDAAIDAYRKGRVHASRAGLVGRVALLEHDEGAALRRQGALSEARELLLRAVAAHRSLDEPYLLALGYQALASIARVELRLTEAQSFGERAIDAARQANDPYALGGALTNQANVMLALGRVEDSIQLNREAVDTLRQGGFLATLCFALGNLGSALEESGDAVEAELLVAEALQVARAARVPYAAAVWSARLAELAHKSGRLDEAAKRYASAIHELDQQQAHPQLELVHGYAAVAHAELRDPEAAQRHLASAAALADGPESDRAALALLSAAVDVFGGRAVSDPLADHPRDLEWAAGQSVLSSAWAFWQRSQRTLRPS